MQEVYLDQEQLRKKRTAFRFKIYLAGFGLAILMLGLGYALVYSPVLKIDKFVIQDSERLSDESVLAILKPLVLKSRIANFLGWHNFLAWSKGEVDVSGTALLTAEIDKGWLTRSIIIEVKERERFGIWCIKNERCYWMDKSGVVFEEAPLTEGGLILKVYDSQKSELSLGSQIVDDRFINNLIVILENLNDLNISVKKIIFNRQLQELEVDAYNGPEIFFSIRFNPTLNINSLKKLSETLNFSRIDYIDLRVENRVYYKNK